MSRGLFVPERQLRTYAALAVVAVVAFALLVHAMAVEPEPLGTIDGHLLVADLHGSIVEIDGTTHESRMLRPGNFDLAEARKLERDADFDAGGMAMQASTGEVVYSWCCPPGDSRHRQHAELRTLEGRVLAKDVEAWSLSPDGPTGAYFDHDGRVWLVDIASGKQTAMEPLRKKPALFHSFLQWENDNHLLALDFTTGPGVWHRVDTRTGVASRVDFVAEVHLGITSPTNGNAVLLPNHHLIAFNGEEQGRVDEIDLNARWSRPVATVEAGNSLDDPPAITLDRAGTGVVLSTAKGVYHVDIATGRTQQLTRERAFWAVQVAQ